jgi:hypothetical protein
MTTICPIPDSGPFWFPTQPGITVAPPAPPLISNEYPAPADSVDVDDDFDPLNPPPSFWCEDLPINTPAVPAEEYVVEALIPPWREIVNEVFAVRSTIDVATTFPAIPTIQPLTLVVRTGISVFEISARNVTLSTRTVLAVDRGAVAIREDLTECFTITGLRIVPFVVEFP